ncbi:MAG: hypothetical protein KBS68_01840 [Clostridiales bacterium]|nr:hypothetical protein [Candidatus Crickella merdequi]
MSKVRIAGTGVATLDLYINRGRMYPGGNEYNVVCHAVRNGAEAGFMGKFGNDEAGRILEKVLVDCGVDVSMSRRETGSSGYSLVTIKDDGDRVFLDWNRQGVTDLNPFEFNAEELEYLKTYDALCEGRLADVSIEKLKFLAEQGIGVCYDFHATYDEHTIEEIAPHIRYAFFSCSHLSEEELRKTLKQAVDAGCEIAVGTRGAEPVVTYNGEAYLQQETLRVEPTDTLGAGDSFIAAFMTSYLASRKSGDDSIASAKRALTAATEYSAGVVVIEGSLGFGYDIEARRLSELVNVPEDKDLDLGE